MTSPPDSRTRGRRTLGGRLVLSLVPCTLPPLNATPVTSPERWPPGTLSEGFYLQQKMKTRNIAMAFISKETRRSRVPRFHLHLPVQLLLWEEVKKETI